MSHPDEPTNEWAEQHDPDATQEFSAVDHDPVEDPTRDDTPAVEPTLPEDPVDEPTAVGATAVGAGAAGAASAGATAVGGTAVGGPTPESDEAPERAPSRRRPLLYLVAALVLIALIAGIAWFAVTTAAKNREEAIRETATSYLTAVADGDAEAALARLSERPANTTLLTRGVLEASREAAPLTAIEVRRLSGQGNDATVDVAYRIGDQPVETTLALVGDGRTTWQVADGVADLTTNETRGVTINGQAITEPTNPVFPGTYTAAPVNGRVAIAGEASAVASNPTQDPAPLNVTLSLSETGRTDVLNTVKGRYDACLAEKVSRPGGCPFGVNDENVEVTPGSVTFNGVNDPWANFNPTLDLGTMTAGGTIPFDINATATITKDSLTTDATTRLTGERGYNVDLTRDPLSVTWW